VLTGGSTTLDGVAFASVGFPLGPGQSIVVCSDGTNYHSQAGLGVAQSLISNTGKSNKKRTFVVVQFEIPARFAAVLDRRKLSA
jgi:hypothetical protein